MTFGTERAGDSGLPGSISWTWHRHSSYSVSRGQVSPSLWPMFLVLSFSHHQPQAGQRQQELQLWLLLLVPHHGNCFCNPTDTPTKTHRHTFALLWMALGYVYEKEEESGWLLISVHSPRTAIMPLRWKCTKISERKCYCTPSRATTSASSLMVRRALASPTPWWGNRMSRINKESFPWYGLIVPWKDDSEFLRSDTCQSNVLVFLLPAVWRYFREDQW